MIFTAAEIPQVQVPVQGYIFNSDDVIDDSVDLSNGYKIINVSSDTNGISFIAPNR